MDQVVLYPSSHVLWKCFNAISFVNLKPLLRSKASHKDNQCDQIWWHFALLIVYTFFHYFSPCWTHCSKLRLSCTWIDSKTKLTTSLNKTTERIYLQTNSGLTTVWLIAGTSIYGSLKLCKIGTSIYGSLSILRQLACASINVRNLYVWLLGNAIAVCIFISCDG